MDRSAIIELQRWAFPGFTKTDQNLSCLKSGDSNSSAVSIRVSLPINGQ